MTALINNAWLRMTGAETATNIYSTFANSNFITKDSSKKKSSAL